DRVAVMQDGRVLQVGAPKEPYDLTRTRFVAAFVGTNNLVPGRVSEQRSGQLVVETALGPLRAIAEAAVGERCVLAIRPENVALDSRPAPDGNLVRGRIAFVSYLGATVRSAVEAAGAPVMRADVSAAWTQ